jgi:phospholipid/cholesterol/gamma-HCH transport system substrate-binding protein
MTTTKEQKVRLGIFAVASGVLFAIVLVVFAGMAFWQARDRYFIEFDSTVYGLEEGADVFLNGVRVGSVSEIAIADVSKVRVAIDIDEDTPIRTDTRAVLQFAGITGLKIVDLRGGSAKAAELAPGDTIPVGETVFDQIEERGMVMLDQTNKLLERANAIAAKTDEIIGSLAEVTETANLDEIAAQTRATARNLARASASLRELVDENREGLSATIATIEEAARRASELVDSNQVRGAIADLRQASRSFKELAREVRQRPSRLLYSPAAPERKLP